LYLIFAFIASLLGIIIIIYSLTGIVLADDGGGLNNLILIDNINIDTTTQSLSLSSEIENSKNKLHIFMGVYLGIEVLLIGGVYFLGGAPAAGVLAAFILPAPVICVIYDFFE